MLSGMDESISDHIYARQSYQAEEIHWNHRFVDVISLLPSGHRMVDLHRFHDTAEIKATAEES
jgi:inward rectifier potassium channel